MRVNWRYTDNNGKPHFNISIKGEKFEGVPGIFKREKCHRRNCKYYYKCKIDEVVRYLDCMRNAKMAERIYNIITAIIVACSVTVIYGKLQLGFFRGTAALLVFLVAFDILCCIGEKMMPTFREEYFYRKLKKRQKKEEEQAEPEEKSTEVPKKCSEEPKVSQKNANRINILWAESSINALRELVDSKNFGKNEEKIYSCINKLSEIIENLKVDNSYYNRVVSLFEVYLPEFYKTLKSYADLKAINTMTEEYEDILTNSVDKFYDLLRKQKVKAILDEKDLEAQFTTAANTLSKIIDEGKE